MTNDDYERSLNARNRELEANIEKVLRGVLELPADERSFAANSWESDACRGASQTASKILIASFAPPPIAKTPKTVAKDLATIKKKSGYLRAQIAAIDGYTRGVINRAGSTHHQEYKAAEADGDLERFIDAFQKAGQVPREQWTIPAAMAAVEELEKAIAVAIERAEKNSQSEHFPKGGGRPPDFVKMNVAIILARFFRDVADEEPKLWPDDAPDERWKRGDPSESYALALKEIFEILGLPRGIVAAGEFATSKL